MEPVDQLAALLIGLFNIALAPQNKRISAGLAERLRTTLCDAIGPGDPIYDLLEDVPTPPRRSPGEAAIDDDEFQRWRNRRAS